MRLARTIAIAALAFVSACASNTSNTTSSATAAPARAGQKTWTCPVCGMDFQGNGQVGYFGQYELHFCGRPDAEQYAVLPKEKRAKIAAAQVLPQKQITNTICPLTGEALTAAAAPVTYDGAIIGFASVADANQFKSLPKAKQQSIIDQWKNQSAATS